MDDADATRLIVVSNRLPVSLKQEAGKWTVTPGAGGLVTALAPVLKDRGGDWIGWSGAAGDADLREVFRDYSEKAGYSLHPVHLTQEEVDKYYFGFSNEIIWPLFHGMESRCTFNPEYWRAYLDVNFNFAEVLAQHSGPDDYVWVHDYHLMHVAFLLKNLGVRRKTGFFLHIPFPSPDIYLKLPWRHKVVDALLDYDLVGFQTMRDRRNFVRCMQALIPGTRVTGRGGVVRAASANRETLLGVFPISIDFQAFESLATTRRAADKTLEIKEAMSHRKIIFGADRLDYTKGIPERIKAIETTLVRYPELHGRISFIQVLVPSREAVGEYQDLKTEIEQLVGQVNGRFSVPGWVPVYYLYRNIPQDELAAYYRAADMAMVTPLRDGMNLVAKEYCACNVAENGVLILSEFAGAASQMQNLGACLVNPYDFEGTARTIRKAFHWDADERTSRMQRLRDNVRRQDIYWWVDSFLQAAFSKHLHDFPQARMVDFHEQ